RPHGRGVRRGVLAGRAAPAVVRQGQDGPPVGRDHGAGAAALRGTHGRGGQRIVLGGRRVCVERQPGQDGAVVGVAKVNGAGRDPAGMRVSAMRQERPYGRGGAVLAGLVLCLVVTLAGAEAGGSKKKPAPSDAAQGKAEKVVRAIFKAKYDKAEENLGA